MLGLTASDVADDITSIEPSGGDFATADVPICMLAPGRFSTTNGCLRRWCSASASIRERMSVEPHGANGTMQVTVRSGYSARTSPSPQPNPTASAIAAYLNVMPRPPLPFGPGG